MNVFKYFCVALLIASPLSWGRPKITVTYSETSTGFTQVKIKNETSAMLACYVAIDGFKQKFQLDAKSSSLWIKATDTRFNYRNFSTWCDYLEIFPRYKAYKKY